MWLDGVEGFAEDIGDVVESMIHEVIIPVGGLQAISILIEQLSFQ